VSIHFIISAGRAARADCETLHSGFVHQPVNTYSSLGFVAVGLWILLRALRRKRRERGESVAFGVALTFAGFGSLVLHGPDPTWGLWFHDLSGLGVLLLVAVLSLGSMLTWSFRLTMLALAVGVVLLALALASRPLSTDHIAWFLVPAAVLSQAAVLRRRHRSSSHIEAPAPTRAWMIAAGTITLAGAAFAAGRSGSPYCHPDSLLQWHAVWHVLAAISAGAFAYAECEQRSSKIRVAGALES
jgi:hypothetical protein